jgi:hypothetical protein
VTGIMISILSANVCLVTRYEAHENSFDICCFLDLRGKFSAIHREYSPNPRKFYAFCTSVTDTATTAGIIASGTYFFILFLKTVHNGRLKQLLSFKCAIW